MVGVPSSGKTTWIKENLPEAIRVCHDDLSKMIQSKYNPAIKNIYHFAEISIAEEALYQGLDVVIDRTCLDKATRWRFIGLADSIISVPVEAIAVVMQTPIEVAKQWNKNPDRLQSDHYVEDDVYEKLLANAEPVSMNEGFSQVLYV